MRIAAIWSVYSLQESSRKSGIPIIAHMNAKTSDLKRDRMNVRDPAKSPSKSKLGSFFSANYDFVDQPLLDVIGDRWKNAELLKSLRW